MQRSFGELKIQHESPPDGLRMLLHDQPPTQSFEETKSYSKKRRKISKDDSAICAVESGGADYLTLARLDLKLKCSHVKLPSPTFCQSFPTLPSDNLPVYLTRFTRTSDASSTQHHEICMTSVSGRSSCSLSLQGDLKPAQCELITKSASLARPGRNIRARGTFTLCKNNESIVADAPGSEYTCTSTVFVLKIRAQLPNSRSLLETPGLPRKLNLQDHFPPESTFSSGPWSPRDFYDHVYTPDRSASSELPPLTLQCNLYPFQQRAIRWLLEREGALPSQRAILDKGLPHGFVQTLDGDGHPCFLSRLLGLATTDSTLVNIEAQKPRGVGILAEEMGLGKTVEVIALITLHNASRSAIAQRPVLEQEQTPATLIITPPGILQQWKDELQTLAPRLKVITYSGMRSEGSNSDSTELRNKCLTNDVVLTTYPVLARDIHHAEGPTKTLRHEKRYEKRLSPLTQMRWWRVILDEAQMVESGVSNSAKVASMIPREHAWCVSGTPARNAKDLLGLLTFLRIQPYCSLPSLWDRLVQEHRNVLWSIFGGISLRHTKAQIRDEIVLPPQTRVVLTIPFTQVEEQHYSSLFQQMAENCGLNQEGAPLREDWDPEDSQVIENMRTWLVRLRQTCLHPEVGSRNRKALGSGKGPLRSVAEVLEVMIEQNETAKRSEERNLLQSQIRRGQILEHAEHTQEALDVWLHTLNDACEDVRECRRQLQSEVETPPAESANRPLHTDAYADVVELSRTSAQQMKLRSALEIEHTCTFFVANAYFQLKTKEIAINENEIDDSHGKQHPADNLIRGDDNTDNGGGFASEHKLSKSPKNGQSDEMLSPDQGGTASKKGSYNARDSQTPMSGRARELEESEEFFYEKAKTLRREMLGESRRKADSWVSKVKRAHENLVNIPSASPLEDQGGLQARKYYEKLDDLVRLMHSQTDQLLVWRRKSAELLMVPLVDEEETELAGDEYEISTKQQDEVYVFIDAFRAAVSDRRAMITGQNNLLIDHEMNLLMKEAREGRGHAPPLLIELLKQRHKLKPSKELGSIRSLMTELRELKTNLRDMVETGNARAAAESLIINNIIQHLSNISKEQLKAANGLDKEVDLFKDTMNIRLEYYRQLQAISDTVAPFEEVFTEGERTHLLTAKQRAEDVSRDRIASLKSKGRYLLHLRDESRTLQPQRTCIICTSPFENGILTSCGHTFCAECLKLWWNQHRNCPTCKKHLRRNDFHQITFRPKDLIMEEESSSVEKSANTSEISSRIYSGVKESTLNQIKDIDLDGSFGTKIDTLARHLFWIREHDPGAKSIVFSQYRDFLDVLGRAFKQFNIGYSSIDGKDGVKKFKNDPHIECFFLHAKAQSSGLNLVNATHVFLCEPLINTAIELQAIARVHRIGQHNETTVWMYLVDNTIEKGIYDVSVQRRLSHIGHMTVNPGENSGHIKADSGEAPGSSPLESQLEAANTLELEQTPLSHLLSKGTSGGEHVKTEDLWSCLFSSRRSRATSNKAPMAVAGHLAAEAAAMRIGGRAT